MRSCSETDHYFLLAAKGNLFALKSIVLNLLNPITGGGGGGAESAPPASFSALYGKRLKMGT